jgi:hypothetical protein
MGLLIAAFFFVLAVLGPGVRTTEPGDKTETADGTARQWIAIRAAGLPYGPGGKCPEDPGASRSASNRSACKGGR